MRAFKIGLFLFLKNARRAVFYRTSLFAPSGYTLRPYFVFNFAHAENPRRTHSVGWSLYINALSPTFNLLLETDNPLWLARA